MIESISIFTADCKTIKDNAKDIQGTKMLISECAVVKCVAAKQEEEKL